ncbi:MAG TPA: hypothetical protein PKC91_12410 [Ignavibacteria bacterium]|nr:hypothetical protein [Ignavibacteria bacterium]
MKNLIAFFLLMFTSCSEVPYFAVTDNEPLDHPHNTVHFSFYFTTYDSSIIRAAGDSLEKHYLRIVNDLGSDTLPVVKIFIYTNYKDLTAAVAHVVPDLPPWAKGLAISESEIHIISPNLNRPEINSMLSILIHEFAHCVSYHIRPNIANNPRWLWESVAVYESGQFVSPHNVNCLVSHDPPSLDQLNSFNNTMIYDVGYLLAEYIIINWDKAHFINMILTNGNIQQVLGISPVDFEKGWFEFVVKKYGI